VKAEAVAAVVGNGAAAAPGVLSDGTRGRRREERMRSPEVGDGGREGRYKAQNAEVAARCLVGKSEEAIVATKAGMRNRWSEGPLLEPCLRRGRDLRDCR
jgi:hypothetical protein